MSDVRVRFAPSPTGFLHVGGARTAIFNWLFARRCGGTFVLRIEDTDARRSSEEMVRAILDGMAWLGLEADEGPYFQSAARERHVRDAATLLERGAAYRCFCAAEALAAGRAAAPHGGRDYAYPRTCRSLPAGEPERRAAAGEPHALRFRVDAHEIAWDDLVHGRTAFDPALIEDFVLLRSDGSPTYMLSVVSDDVAMRISHVIRGDDHISNTPKQLLLYRALGCEPPVFAHLPLILGEDKKRLSKRHGAVSVLAYRERGYLPQAMLNFLALLGWSPGNDREMLERDELVAAFDLERIGRSGAVFDLRKLDWLNGRFLAQLSDIELSALLRGRLVVAGLWRDAFDGAERPALLDAIGLLKDRLRTLDDFVALARPYLDPADGFEYDAQAAKKHLAGNDLAVQLRALCAAFEGLDDWRAEMLETALREVAETYGIAAGKLIHPTRLAVTGQGVSPGIFAVLVTLGRTRSLARLQRLLAHLDARASS